MPPPPIPDRRPFARFRHVAGLAAIALLTWFSAACFALVLSASARPWRVLVGTGVVVLVLAGTVLVVSRFVRPRRPAVRWLPFVSILALVSVAVWATFYIRPLDDGSEDFAIAVSIEGAKPGILDRHTSVTMEIRVYRCSEPAEVTIISHFPKTQVERGLGTLVKTPGDPRRVRAFVAIPDASVYDDDDVVRRAGPWTVFADGAFVSETAYVSDVVFVTSVGWIHRRGVGSCYLRVPELLPADGAYAALDLVSPDQPTVWGDVTVHTTLDVARGPFDETAGEVRPHRKCDSNEWASFCAFDVVLTEPWRKNFENVMLLVIGALFSVLAELGMRAVRRRSA